MPECPGLMVLVSPGIVCYDELQEAEEDDEEDE